MVVYSAALKNYIYTYLNSPELQDEYGIEDHFNLQEMLDFIKNCDHDTICYFTSPDEIYFKTPTAQISFSKRSPIFQYILDKR